MCMCVGDYLEIFPDVFCLSFVYSYCTQVSIQTPQFGLSQAIATCFNHLID